MEYKEQLDEWFEKYEGQNLEFKNLENKFHESQQVSAVMFLASKLKDKSERFFFHGEHDILYIGSSFDVFEEFTEEEVKIAVAHDLMVSDSGGFEMYASM